MTQTATKRNGRTATAVCRHSPNCEVAQTQRDLQAQVQAFSETVGEGMERVAIALEKVKRGHDLMLQRQEQHSDRLLAMSGHLADIAERQTVASQREEEWVKSVNELTRMVSRIVEGADA